MFGDLVPKPPERLTAKGWIDAMTVHQRLHLQQRIVTFLLTAYGSLLFATMGIFLLQGFHLFGFSLDLKVLFWLGGATIGGIGGLLLLTGRLVFRR